MCVCRQAAEQREVMLGAILSAEARDRCASLCRSLSIAAARPAAITVLAVKAAALQGFCCETLP